MKIAVTCISKEKLLPPINLPFYCHTEGFRDFPHYPRVKTVERIEYLASRRNGAVKELISRYPETDYVFMIDTYYFSQIEQMKNLITEYKFRPMREDVILGTSTWFRNPSRIPATYEFWDSWTNPEFNRLKIKNSPHGWNRVTGAGGFTIFPVWAWLKQGYGVPYPFPESGCETNYLSRCPGIETFLSFDTKAWRDPPEELLHKPFSHRLRTTLGLGSKYRTLKRRIT